MASNQFVRNLMGQQRRRAVGTLMTYIEREVYPKLDPAQQRALRGHVIAATTQYHDVTLDILNSAVDDGTTVNAEALTILARMEGKLSRALREES